MTFKTILTVTGTHRGDDDIKLATGLCEEVGAHLSVLAVALAAPPPIGDYAAPISDAWMEERRADLERLEKRTAAVSHLLARSAISADVTSAYAEIGWADEIIGRRARYADLTVIGPELLLNGTLKDKTIEGALFSSGKPMLLAPEGVRPTLRPRKVMVAWDSRIEASRAVREAIDLLTAADDVRLVLVDPVEGESHQGAEPGADVATYLARHGAKVTVERLPGSGKSVAEVLKRHAADMSADLVVMGAYGHSRLRERLFGGVTKSIFNDLSMPVLMAH
ncbi:nucleotide-binding universal stress UspA family protein [Aminobacter aminovorans]|uniref:Universal stress protein family n=1 Tax=Aminobacter aminovorans TaxID=83263 RepID=A0A380WLK6_AMIAI|nr:universal stress protein [Aminobacter aminovorans]TCS27973.1 nucleotide-binding universal stress UspA family protein [Aminobacter aminovorans]SUU89615.1 Universal stress protein family [Aminobacter aminovorans]